ncbi:MAG: hypothetical protein H0V62_06705 [Gammaproteobacteria bacterium]|nr:hypothetical protein [Gammaproteobacteria bacterium]
MLQRFPHHKPRRVERTLESEMADDGKASTRLRFRHPMLALVCGLVRTSAHNDITHWYALMTPSVHRLLSHFGLELQVIGPSFEHHGERRPHFDSIRNVMDRAHRQRRDVWELVTDYGRLSVAPCFR